MNRFLLSLLVLAFLGVLSWRTMVEPIVPDELDLEARKPKTLYAYDGFLREAHAR